MAPSAGPTVSVQVHKSQFSITNVNRLRGLSDVDSSSPDGALLQYDINRY